MDINVQLRRIRCISLNEVESRYLASLTQNCLQGMPASEDAMDKQIRENLHTCATRDIEGFASYKTDFLGEE